MELTGGMLIGSHAVKGCSHGVQAVNPATSECLDPMYLGGTRVGVDSDCELAWGAFDAYRELTSEKRARLLETIPEEIEAIGCDLIERAMAESGLPAARLKDERARTCGQLRLFARTLKAGEWLDVRIDPMMPTCKQVSKCVTQWSMVAPSRQLQIHARPLSAWRRSSALCGRSAIKIYRMHCRRKS